MKAILVAGSICGLLASIFEQAVAFEGIPTAILSESIICCPSETVSIDGWASVDPGGEIVKWLWDLDGDGQVDTMTETGVVTIQAPPHPTSSVIILKVRDNEGNESVPDTAILHIMKSPLKISVAYDSVIQIGTRVSFEPVVSSACTQPAEFAWDFDDDGSFEFVSPRNGKTSRMYRRAGKFKNRFTVTDNTGQSASVIKTVYVTPTVPAGESPREQRQDEP